MLRSAQHDGRQAQHDDLPLRSREMLHSVQNGHATAKTAYAGRPSRVCPKGHWSSTTQRPQAGLLK